MSDFVSIEANHPPADVAQIAATMSGYPAPWALCGGWAVDAWLGGHSREHGDIDVAVFIEDQRVLFEHLSDWQLIAHAPGTADDTNELWNGIRVLELPAHIHARHGLDMPIPSSGALLANDGFVLDIQFCVRDGGEWVLWDDPRIAMPLSRAITDSPWGVPMALPEVLLFYKSLDLRQRDKRDFQALRPLMSDEQRAWLKEAIARVGHPWLSKL